MCTQLCGHMGTLRLNSKISMGVGKSTLVCEFLWSQLSSFSKHWTSELLLCLSPQRSVSPSCIWLSVSVHHFPKWERSTASEGEPLWKNAGLHHIMAMEAIKELQKTTRDILLEVLFSIKHFLTSSHLLQAGKNKTRLFTLSPG